MPSNIAVAAALTNSYNSDQADQGFSLRWCVDETVDHRSFDRTIWIRPDQHRRSGITDQVSDELSTAVLHIRQ
jgi:hypothetical protein